MIDFDEFDPFGPEAGFKKITPTQAEQLVSLAGDDKLAEFKALQAQLIEANDQDYDIRQCLEAAIASSAANVRNELIEVQGVKPGLSECHTAMKNGQWETLDYLLSHGADPHEDNDMLIHLGAGYNQVKALEVLAKHGANNYTPLINDFITSNQSQAALYMLENGAVPNTQTLERACKIENLTILKHLLAEKGMVPTKEFIQNMHPRFVAAKHLLTKAYQQHSFQNKMPPKTKAKPQSKGMKI